MKSVEIEEICIDKSGSLSVTPKNAEFPYIYREAMEVHWDNERKCLYSPKPRVWTYLDWFKQIKMAASNQQGALVTTESTRWSNIDDELKLKILNTQ